MSEGNQTLKKCKSMCDITDAVPSGVAVYTTRSDNFRNNRRITRTYSDSSVEIVVVDTDSEEGAPAQLTDSGLADRSAFDGHALTVLEHKIDRLNDMFQEQCRLLATLKEDIRSSKAAMEKVEHHHTNDLADFFHKTAFRSSEITEESSADAGSSRKSGARSLLDAIESRQGVSELDQEVRDALVSFLQSEELKEHMVSATAESVSHVIGECISQDLSSLYLPMLEHSHKRLVRHVNKTVEDAFIELEKNSACLSRSVYKITNSLRRSIERHQHLLEAATNPNNNLMAVIKCTVEELLHKELKQWRQKILDMFSDVQPEPDELEPAPLESISPLQPHSGLSIIDQLMMAAEISNKIECGDVNAAFERALGASDLSLVMAACRRAAAVVFEPHCQLRQHVLLALLQQLSTDMLHDTQLKCRYLEDSIINLDLNNAVTQAHLPLVVGEVRKHLTKFLASYPSHVASRRITLIIMAADNLLK